MDEEKKDQAVDATVNESHEGPKEDHPETERQHKKRLKKEAKAAKKQKRKEKYESKSIVKENLLAFLITFILFVVSEYFTLTPINIRDKTFLMTLPCVLIIFMILRLLFLHRFGKSNIILLTICALCVCMFYTGDYFSSKFFFAKEYANQITLKKSNKFYEDMKNVKETQVPVVDKASAIKLGDKNMGSISNYVSQFKVDKTYNQINYRGKPYRVTMLDYGSNIKWLTNHFDGLPAYIRVDMTTQDTEVVKLSKPIKYSKTDKIFRDINRYIRFRFPFSMFDSPSFELDENGTPFWVAPVYTYKIGLFGGKDIIGAITVNAQNGQAKYYSVKKVPSWVDRVYPASLLMKQLKNMGKYSKGYLNTIFSQKGVLKPTSGYNYVAIGKDIWLTTGLTSVSGDSSNVGFALVNTRTKEGRYYPISGATEASAMKSAAGKAQEHGYKPTFPILLNIENVPTYFLSLKDNEGLVKKYAFVSVEHYETVGIGDTVKAARDNYYKLMKESGHLKESVPQGSVTGKVTAIKDVVVNGTTTYYINVEGASNTFIASVTLNDQLPTVQVGTNVTITYATGQEQALNALSVKING